MTQETHVTAGHETTQHFPDAEWQQLRKEDLAGAKAIVCLMAGIFVVGLALYLFVAWWVS